MAILIDHHEILVVDDEAEMQNLFDFRFRKKIAGGTFRFIYALSADQALAILDQNPKIDLVLCDINMPGMDGLTLLPILLDWSKTLRVVMVSAYGDMSNIRKAMNLGAYDFVTKPINFNDLEMTIEKSLKEVAIAKRAKISRELEKKNETLQELDQMKSRFFTNISHEFRTPITAIQGAARQIRQFPEEWVEKGVPIIERNADRLQRLTNQVLDLRRLELGKSIDLQLVQGNIITFINYLLDSFRPQLQAKSIQLNFNSKLSELQMDFDPDKLTSILSNLLSNALKYTPRGGVIGLAVDRLQERIQVRVSDTGTGISEEELPLVFDRFFRASTHADEGGTGVGLALTKELVERLEGTIRVESEVGQGSTFTVELPISRQAEAASQDQLKTPLSQLTPAPMPVLQTPAEDERPSLLIVEDNIDIAQYLRACLEGEFMIRIAWDGQEGIDEAITHIPDIIISDVMMPVKDGYELCRTLKNDRRTSHIPLILLTAKSETEDRIEGLEMGADAYLSKPFNQKELFVRLNKLLELRQKLQKHYSSLDNLPQTEEQAGGMEDSFLWSVRKAIEDHMDDLEFGIPDLCRAVGASRTQLHRKIKALTNQSTSIFVRSIRLNHAKKLLQTTNLNVTQVAFEVGFQDPKYFSTKFSELFGQRPSAFRKGLN